MRACRPSIIREANRVNRARGTHQILKGEGEHIAVVHQKQHQLILLLKVKHGVQELGVLPEAFNNTRNSKRVHGTIEMTVLDEGMLCNVGHRSEP